MTVGPKVKASQRAPSSITLAGSPIPVPHVFFQDPGSSYLEKKQILLIHPFCLMHPNLSYGKPYGDFFGSMAAKKLLPWSSLSPTPLSTTYLITFTGRDERDLKFTESEVKRQKRRQ